MKLHTSQTNIERDGVQGESAFTIKTNALSFSILSSGLYTDPEMAIVRELSCNAYDAHVAAGNEKTPFEIHLPNNLEPFFSIKDFGIGLSDEDIRGEMVPVMVENDNGELIQSVDDNGKPAFTRSGGLYTTYFDSTKTNSNDFIGALGLGSKSPFSYSDAFEVVSRYHGTKRTYAIFLNEEGIPTVALMGEIATDEHSGLEVKITIKPDDFYKFKQKTATALKYFPVKPKVIGALNFEFDSLPTHKIETKDWMLSSTDRWNNSTFIAVQGNVAYRVDSNQFKDQLDNDMQNFVERSNIVAFFNIGELEVSANREEIRYDKRSVEAIVDRVKNINKEFTREVEKKIGNINKKYWYACIELNTLAHELFGREDAIRAFVKANLVKNKILKRYIEEDGRVGYKRILGYELTRYAINGYYSKTTRLKKLSVSSTFVPDGGTLIVINDVKKGGLARLRDYIEENSYNDAIVITQHETALSALGDDNEPLPYEGFEKEWKRLCKELGNPDIHKISEITEEPEKVPANRQLTFYRYDGLHSARGSYYSADKVSWEQTEHDINDGGLYIPLKYGSTPCLINSEGNLTPLGYNRPEDTVKAIKFLIKTYNDTNDTNHTINTIVGLPMAAFNKVKKMDSWVNLFEFGKEILPDYINEISFHRRRLATSGILDAKNALKYEVFVDNVKALDDDSEFKLAMLPLIEGTEHHCEKTMENVMTIESLYNKLFKGEVIEIDDTPFYDEMAFKKYPMLTLVESLGYNTEWSTLFDYIKLIDRSE